MSLNEIIDWMMEDIYSFDILENALKAYFKEYPQELERLRKVMIEEYNNIDIHEEANEKKES